MGLFVSWEIVDKGLEYRTDSGIEGQAQFQVRLFASQDIVAHGDIEGHAHFRVRHSASQEIVSKGPEYRTGGGNEAMCVRRRRACAQNPEMCCPGLPSRSKVPE